MKNKAKRVAMVGMLSAVAYAFMAIGRVPVVLFLKYDPKDVVITLGGLIWGPLTALAVSAVTAFLEMVSLSDTGFIGFVMNLVSSCAFACTASAIYRKRRTLRAALLGLLAGMATMIAVMLLWNYLVTPLYMGVPREQVAKLLLPAFLPFNAIKGGLNAAFTFILYKPLIQALRRSGLADPSEGHETERFSGWILLAVFIIITCVLLIFSLNGLI